MLTDFSFISNDIFAIFAFMTPLILLFSIVSRFSTCDYIRSNSAMLLCPQLDPENVMIKQ